MASTRVFAAFLLILLFKIHLSAQNFENFISKDNPEIQEWASGCIINRGYINISDTSETFSANGITSNHAFFGTDSMALGIADGSQNVVSLGDAGWAVLTFQYPIANGEGTDFAVFENAMESLTQSGQYFIEPAFVEVSSDGLNYFRFPARTEIPNTQQLGSFGLNSPDLLHNLAGNAPPGLGTPFDLEEMKDIFGLDITRITHVKIIDIPGSILPEFAKFDALGNIINAPFPTPFNTCGFDLNALAVIHIADNSESEEQILVKISPNPSKTSKNLAITIQSESRIIAQIFDIYGHCIYQIILPACESSLKIPDLATGVYILSITSKTKSRKLKFIIR